MAHESESASYSFYTSLSSPGFNTGASLAHFGLSSPSHSFWCRSNLQSVLVEIFKQSHFSSCTHHSLPVILRLHFSHWKDSSCFLMWELYFLSSAKSKLQMLHFLSKLRILHYLINDFVKKNWIYCNKLTLVTCRHPAWSCELLWSAFPVCSASHTCCHA